MAFDNLDQGEYSLRLDFGPFVKTGTLAAGAKVSHSIGGVTRDVSVLNASDLAGAATLLSVGVTEDTVDQVADGGGDATDVRLQTGQSVTKEWRTRIVWLKNNGANPLTYCLACTVLGTASDADAEYPLLTGANYGEGVS